MLTFQPVPQCPVCELHRHLYGATPAERLFLILKAALEVTEKAGTMPAAFTLAVGASELLFIWRPDTDWKYASARAPNPRPPSNMTQPGSGATASTTPTIWIPVDGSLTLGEDYVDTPEKSAGVAKANELLKKGEHKQAMDTLKH